jgi:hypothetical protein
VDAWLLDMCNREGGTLYFRTPARPTEVTLAQKAEVTWKEEDEREAERVFEMYIDTEAWGV